VQLRTAKKWKPTEVNTNRSALVIGGYMALDEAT
jgi:hypothetical protein